MKKVIEWFFIILLAVACLVIADELVAFLRKDVPIISWKDEIENGEVYHSLAYDIYGCTNLGETKLKEWRLKGKDPVTCPPSDIVLEADSLTVTKVPGYFSKNQYIKLATNNAELKDATKYIQTFKGKYEDEFFDTKNIIIAYFPTEKDTNTAEFKQVYISNTVSVTISSDVDKSRTDKSYGFAFIIEIDKEYVTDKELSLVIKS